MSRAKKSFIISLFVAIVFIVGVYLAIAFYFEDRFFSGTIINGVDCSGRTVEDVEEAIASHLVDYTLAIYDKTGNKEYIIGTDINMEFLSEGEIRKLKEKQNAKLWFLYIFSDDRHTLELETSYDQSLLRQKVEQLDIFKDENIVEPQDAYVELIDNRYEIISEVEGNKADIEAVYDLVLAAVEAGESTLQLADHADEIYLKPEITADDPELKAQVMNYNDFMEFTITHEFGSRSETLSGERLQDWVDIDDEFNITVDRDAVANYVYQLASTYNTFGSNRQIVSSATGQNVTVEGGDYGWVIDQSAEVEELVEIIIKGESVTREPVYAHEAMSREEDDVGNTYVEISIDSQHLWYYVDGTLKVESDIVSGLANGKRDTNTGTYPVMWKDTDVILRGEGYASPVDYFIPFYPDVGLHDASWRSSFGGSIYKSNGSHGCINMPRDKVKQIYDSISVGTAVYVY